MSFRDRSRADAVNVHGARSAAVGAKAAGVKKFVYLSSASVYGVAGCEHGYRESDMGKKLSWYGLSKLSGEYAVRDELNGSDTDLCCIRAPLIYGAGKRTKISRLLKLVRAGMPLPVVSHPVSRSVLSIELLGRVIIKMAKVDSLPFDVVNVADVELINFSRVLSSLSVADNELKELNVCRPVSYILLKLPIIKSYWLGFESSHFLCLERLNDFCPELLTPRENSKVVDYLKGVKD